MLYEPEVWRVKSRKLVMIFSLVCFVALALALLFLPDFRQEKFLTGAYIGQEGDYIQLKLHAGDTIYVKANKLPKLPKLRPGDTIVVDYYHDQFTFLPYYNNIISIQKLAEADWGISLNTADVTSTGMRLLIDVDSEYSRDLTFSAYTLEASSGISWKPLSNQSVSHAPTLLSDGGSVQLRWESVYGALEPGMYRVCATVSHDGANRKSYADFTVPYPLPTTLKNALDQAVYHILSRQIIDPPVRSANPERIRQTEGLDLLRVPALSAAGSLSFEQITYSYDIHNYQQTDGLHSFQIVGMCRGYNGQTPAAEFCAPMWLTIQQNSVDSFVAVSCKMPFVIEWSSSAPQFPVEATTEVMINNQRRNSLRAACDAQVIGGVYMPPIKGDFYTIFHKGSSEAKAILQAISSGKQVMRPVSSKLMYTILIDHHAYYVNRSVVGDDLKAYIYTIYDLDEDIYTELTVEGEKDLVLIHNAATTIKIDNP